MARQRQRAGAGPNQGRIPAAMGGAAGRVASSRSPAPRPVRQAPHAAHPCPPQRRAPPVYSHPASRAPGAEPARGIWGRPLARHGGIRPHRLRPPARAGAAGERTSQQARTHAAQAVSTRLLLLYKESRSRPRHLQGAGLSRGRAPHAPRKIRAPCDCRSAAKDGAGPGALWGKCHEWQSAVPTLDRRQAAA